MHFNVIIETVRAEDGSFRADGVDGPWFVLGLLARASDRDLAFTAARIHAEGMAPFAGDTFSFMHVKG